MIQQSYSWAENIKLRFEKKHVPSAHSSTIYNSQDVETAQMPSKR